MWARTSLNIRTTHACMDIAWSTCLNDDGRIISIDQRLYGDRRILHCNGCMREGCDGPLLAVVLHHPIHFVDLDEILWVQGQLINAVLQLQRVEAMAALQRVRLHLGDVSGGVLQ